MSEPNESVPTLEEFAEARALLGERVLETPVWQWRGREIAERAGRHTDVFLKLELFQYSGTFKPRGALLNMLALDPVDLRMGVTAVSAGNHAMAVGYAAGVLGTTAKVVMPIVTATIEVQSAASVAGPLSDVPRPVIVL